MARKKKGRSQIRKAAQPKTSSPAAPSVSQTPSVWTAWRTGLEKGLRTVSKYSLWFEVITLVVIIGTGVLFRLEDLDTWNTNKQKAFYNNQPLHTTFDAWFYLSLAQDLVDNTYHPKDEKRGIPNCPPRPSPPPAAPR